MPAQLNHTIVHAKDKVASAQFLADILGLPKPRPFGPFMVVDTANGVSLDFMTSEHDEITIEHYAFLVSEPEFDEIFARIEARHLDYWADRPAGERARSTTTMVAAASTGATRAVTFSRSSLARTARATDPPHAPLRQTTNVGVDRDAGNEPEGLLVLIGEAM
jgi:hypothetical protein